MPGLTKSWHRPDTLWILRGSLPANWLIFRGRPLAHLLLGQEGMLLTALLTVVFVGVSSLMLWLAIGAD
jgi:hypothetical protein